MRTEERSKAELDDGMAAILSFCSKQSKEKFLPLSDAETERKRKVMDMFAEMKIEPEGR